MCDRCDSKEEFTEYDYKIIKRENGIYDRTTRKVILCLDCARLWLKVYHVTYPKGANTWEWNKLFGEFIKSSKLKVKVILI